MIETHCIAENCVIVIIDNRFTVDSVSKRIHSDFVNWRNMCAIWNRYFYECTSH